MQRGAPPSFACVAIALAVVSMPHDKVRAESIVFPGDARVINAKNPPYNAVGDGVTDDTRAINRALDSFPNGNRIIYLPNGTYLISDTLSWPNGPGGNEFKRTILQGQSESGTVIKLLDNAPLYQDTAAQRPMIYTGPRPAQRFRNSIRNVTIDAGSGNPGAIGVQFHANNQGCMRSVTIRCSGPSKYGLDLGYTAEIGPCLMKDLTVTGFGIGIFARHPMNSITFEHVTLAGQSRYGIYNEGQVLTIRDLHSSNAVTALYNAGRMGHVTLIDAVLTGTGSASGQPALVNDWVLFCLNVTTPGYQQAVVNNNGGMPGVDSTTIAQYVSNPVTTLFPSSESALDLEVEETPEIAWADTATWTNPVKYGATANDLIDDTRAIQEAIDSAATTVYFPNGEYRIDGTLYLRGRAQRLVGCEARLAGNGKIVVSDGDAPTVILERFDTPAGSTLSIEHASTRTLVLSSSILGRCTVTGTGKLFIEDVCMGPLRLSGQKAWARQLNIESDTPHVVTDSDTAKVVNAGGDLWVLNLKTEKSWTTVKTRNGGRTEVFGGLLYPSSKVVPPEQPAFHNDNSSMAVSVSECLYKGWYNTVVKETRGSATILLADTALPRRMSGADVPYWQTRTDSLNIARAFSLPLYVGDATQDAGPLAGRPGASPAAAPAWRITLTGRLSPVLPARGRIVLYNIRGERIAVIDASHGRTVPDRLSSGVLFVRADQ